MQTTPANKHKPVYDHDFIMGYAVHGDSRALDLLAFNKQWPTRRHWHHAVHTAARQPCDDLCKPKQTYSGTSLIERIKAAYRVEDIASRLTTLRGNEVLTGKCPLHGETHGESFKVNIELQKWKCWGACGISGDVIDLVRACVDRGIEWTKS